MSYNDWTLSYKKAVAAFPKLPASATRYLTYAIGMLGFIGFLDAMYLTLLHYKNAIPPCTIHGCEVVLTSHYATIAGVPISLIGVVYYLSIIILVGVLLAFTSSTSELSSKQYELSKKKEHNSLFIAHTATIPTLLVLLTGIGLLIGLGLVFLQAFVLHAFCQYCLLSELIDFLLFDCSWWLWRRTE